MIEMGSIGNYGTRCFGTLTTLFHQIKSKTKEGAEKKHDRTSYQIGLKWATFGTVDCITEQTREHLSQETSLAKTDQSHSETRTWCQDATRCLHQMGHQLILCRISTNVLWQGFKEQKNTHQGTVHWSTHDKNRVSLLRWLTHPYNTPFSYLQIFASYLNFKKCTLFIRWLISYNVYGL